VTLNSSSIIIIGIVFLLETVLNNLILEFYSFKEFLAVAFNLFLMKKLIPLLLMYKCFICVYMFTVKW